MSPLLVLTTIATYFLILFAVSYIAGRKTDNQGFFVGNRKSSWIVVAFAMIGSSISGVTFVSVPGMVGSAHFSYLQMALGFVVGQFIIAFLLIPLFYRMNLVSIYGYLDNRFGVSSHKTGAWFFFISKMLGASVRLFVVCLTLQLLVFDALRISFVLNVVCTVGLVWLYTFRSGVKSLVWTDSLKTFCLITSVILCIYFISTDLQLNLGELISAVKKSDLSRIFFLDDMNDRRYFFKQFPGGIFTMIAMTGLDQDFMQRNLSCKNAKDSQKNIITGSLVQFFINLLFLVLGVILFMFTERNGIRNPDNSDALFPLIATGGHFPIIVGVLFIVGLISSAYATAGSALTALTTSFTIDIMGIEGKNEDEIRLLRKKIHFGMTLVMGVVIFVFGVLNNSTVIDAVYTLAGYTYGPILGMFAFGIFMKQQVRDKYIPIVAILSPILCYVIQQNSERWFNGYQFSYELLLINALFTFAGLWMLTKRKK